MTFKKTAAIVLGIVALAAASSASLAENPYESYTSHSDLEIATDVELDTDALTTGSIEPGCILHLPYTGHGGLEVVKECGPTTDDGSEQSPSP